MALVAVGNYLRIPNLPRGRVPAPPVPPGGDVVEDIAQIARKPATAGVLRGKRAYKRAREELKMLEREAQPSKIN